MFTALCHLKLYSNEKNVTPKIGEYFSFGSILLNRGVPSTRYNIESQSLFARTNFVPTPSNGDRRVGYHDYHEYHYFNGCFWFS